MEKGHCSWKTFGIVVLFQLMQISCAISNWPIKHKSYIPGDLLIGGFFPIHGSCTKLLCTRLQAEGFYLLEAFIYTVKKINEDEKLLPGVKLGAIAVDSCDSVAYSLEETTEFIKGFIARDNALLTELNFECSDSSIPRYSDGRFDKVIGIVGAQSSRVSIQLANVLRLFRIPQICYQSATPKLSDKTRYEYFFKVVPQLDYQVKVMLDILSIYDWRYISVVYSDTPYGNDGFVRLQKLTEKMSICISSQQRVNILRFLDAEYDNLVWNLQKKNATAVVVFGDKHMARNLMAAVTRRQLNNRFIWIGSEAWCGRKSVADGNEKVLEGAICVSHVTKSFNGFDDYLKSLDPEIHRKENPWFPEFMEEKFKCKYPDFPLTPFNKNYSRSCAMYSTIVNETYIEQTPTVQFVRDAVYAFAQSLHNLLKQKCTESFDQCLKSLHINGKELRRKIAEVRYKDENGDVFSFDKNGDAVPRYSIINFQKKPNSEEYIWKLVGSYWRNESNAKGELDRYMDEQEVKYKQDQPFPSSSCSKSCEVGEIKIYLGDGKCCWHCRRCSDAQYIDGNKQCRECLPGTLPNPDRSNCTEIPERFFNDSYPAAIAALSLSLVGILTTAFVSNFVWVFWDTPVVKTSGRYLNCLLLVGTFLCFCLTFPIICKPSPWTCGIVQFSVGFCYTICYATIVAKIRKIVNYSKNNIQKVNYEQRQSSIAFALTLVSIEGILNLTWILHDEPEASQIYPTWKDNILICKGVDSARYLVGLIYPLLLTCFSTIYAFKMRNLARNVDEVRLITFTNYTTCVIWLAFLPTFLLNNNHAIRSASLSFFLIFNCFVQLFCLFAPKIYIAYFKPHKNTEEYVARSGGRQFSSLSMSENTVVH